ncbi:MAG: DUF6390 family protein [Nocardioidaceae bacterium]
MLPINGPQLFARYAYPPNALGYCGPADSDALLQYGAAGVTDLGLTQLARGFEGAWPYLELIASGCGIRDPLDRRVVEAYWVGSPLLDTVKLTSIGNSLEDRFRGRMGLSFSNLIDGVEAGGVPHHNFHVFEVSPWLGLMRGGAKTATAVGQLDRCRIRWGTVVAIACDEASVRSSPLEWDGLSMVLGEPRVETARIAVNGTGFLDDLAAGDVVSLHWGWVCDRLTARQLQQLRHYTMRHMDIANGLLQRRSAGAAIE